MPVTRNPISYILIAWLGSGVVRVLLGSNTSPVAYFFFGTFWLISVILLIAAIRLLLVSKKKEQIIEAASLCAGLVSFFVLGLVGAGDAAIIAVPMFLISAVVLVCIYAKRAHRTRVR
jgi:ABC-type phosphate transport system permease subunit